MISHQALRSMVFEPPEITPATVHFPDGVPVKLTGNENQQSAWVIIRIWDEVVAVQIDGRGCENTERFKSEARKLHANLHGWLKTDAVQQSIKAHVQWVESKGKKA